MSGVPGPERSDDDALADAILASYTSSIPIIPPGSADLDWDVDLVDERAQGDDRADDAEHAEAEAEAETEAIVGDVLGRPEPDSEAAPAPRAEPDAAPQPVPIEQPDAIDDTPAEGPLAPEEPAPSVPFSWMRDSEPVVAADRGSSAASGDGEPAPWLTAPPPAAPLTAQIDLPPAALVGSNPDAAAAKPVASPAGGLLGDFAADASAGDAFSQLERQLRDLAPPDPAAVVPLEAPAMSDESIEPDDPAAPAESLDPATTVAPAGVIDPVDLAESAPRPPVELPPMTAPIATVIAAPESASPPAAPPSSADPSAAEWAAAPPPVFAAPPLVEPPSRDPVVAPFGDTVAAPPPAPDAPASSDAPPAGAADPDSPPTDTRRADTPPAEGPRDEAIDLSAFAPPSGPPSGVITLPPEAWLAEHPLPAPAPAPAAGAPIPNLASFDALLPDDERPELRLEPRLDTTSLIDPRLSAAATSDADYSDDDDGSVDPEDRAPVAAVPAAPAMTPRRPDLGTPPPVGTATRPGTPAAGAADGTADGGVDAEPTLDTPAAAADATSVVVPPARLPRILSLEFDAVEPTPLERRAGSATRMLWLAFGPSASLLVVGLGAGLIAAGASLRQAVVAVLIGAALSCLPLGLGALAGKWSGQPALVTSRAVFGLIGNVLPTVLALLARVGWAAVLLWLAADAVGGLVATSDTAASGTARMVALLVGLVIACAIAVVGYGLLSLLQAIASVVGLVVAGGVIALTVPRLDLTAALMLRDGPWSLVLGGAVLVLAVGGLALAQSIGDLARYQRPAGHGSANMVAAALGSAVPLLVLGGWGALLAASDRDLGAQLVRDPAGALASLLPAWALVPVLLGAALSAVAAAAVAVYSGGLALAASGIRAPRPIVTLPAALVTALLALALLAARAESATLLRDAAITLAVPVAAWAGLVAGDLMLRSRRFHTPSLLRRGGAYRDVRPANLVALVLATAIGWMLTTGETAAFGWQGGLFPLLGLSDGDPIADADPGVLVALALGLAVALISGARSVRRQEIAVVAPEPTL
ncbi:cytosine permease [Schumannella sp. 10F1B-5-1]|uniref:cytosine permease n=1 Tax=Schumannella sp. 10F1B-5-1 TaxID=2590780 RepID=UPI0011323A0F|nr:cytosine permease [Schumannella sp. 10F1B-5-1]TPW70845.1 hypothetical protein FJ658_12060 [Schumannella sp. 10F1B-5-1]